MGTFMGKEWTAKEALEYVDDDSDQVISIGESSAITGVPSDAEACAKGDEIFGNADSFIVALARTFKLEAADVRQAIEDEGYKITPTTYGQFAQCGVTKKSRIA